ncbi:MAG TPA: hypothetical protein VGG16_08720 [Streptosporangiaceae bacterium]
MYRETFWVAVSAAAPVIALAVVVAYNDMKREEALFKRQTDPLLRHSLPVWRYFPAPGLKIPKDARRARRWTWASVGLHRLNVLGQAAVLAFSLTSLAQQVNEMPLALAIAAEVGGLVALLGAGAAAERKMDALYEVAVRWAAERDDSA